ncbi:hypothetical protein FE810_05665 [Thalassotalea litorea]|uniref:Uncharacterized protein n=1 Tax=Thalassotalea litorea TaxID=2020715 RepID=A0A5R9IP10_9GAMM|nr:hypothetical protein [Thalassotalea litorea]TLU66203.1 hypothetical protein FE810_05665 [Thalassotalea litorea]
MKAATPRMAQKAKKTPLSGFFNVAVINMDVLNVIIPWMDQMMTINPGCFECRHAMDGAKARKTPLSGFFNVAVINMDVLNAATPWMAQKQESPQLAGFQKVAVR